jgi:hypothetical protein
MVTISAINMSLKGIFIMVFGQIMLLSCIHLSAQYMVNDSLLEKYAHGLEGIIIEPYYLHSGNDCKDDTTLSIAGGNVTYRVFIDMAPQYRLQAIYGIEKHPFVIKTTTSFYDNIDFGSKVGIDITEENLIKCNVAFDTWLTLGAASKSNLGVLKEEDSTGSVLFYDGLRNQDGMVPSENMPVIQYYVRDFTLDNTLGSATFRLNDAVIAVKNGITGLSGENRVLIAQITTDGAISLIMNVQVITPDARVIRYVAENPAKNEIQYNGLIINDLKLTDYGIQYLPN